METHRPKKYLVREPTRTDIRKQRVCQDKGARAEARFFAGQKI